MCIFLGRTDMLAAFCGRALSLLYGLTWSISPAPLLVVCALYCVIAIQRVSLGAKRFLFVSAILLCLLELCSLEQGQQQTRFQTGT